jgi:hypothetical protein
MRRPVAFLGAMLAGALGAHVAFSAAVSAWIGEMTSHRLFNVRNIEDQGQWWPLTRLFVEGQGIDDPRPKILMFGSSVTWGYSWPERDVFASHMQEELVDFQVLNIAIIGQDLISTIRLECNLQDLTDKIALSIIEISIFNLILRDQPSAAETTCDSDDDTTAYTALGGPLNYFSYTLLHPWGIEYFRAFWNEYDYSQAEQPFTWNELPESYFPDLDRFLEKREQLDGLIRSAIVGASRISEKVAIFIAPTLREGLELSGYSPNNLQLISDLVMDSCKKMHEAICLDPGLDLPREDFGNLTHLNLKGHEDFANWLLQRLDLSGLEAAGVPATGHD